VNARPVKTLVMLAALGAGCSVVPFPRTDAADAGGSSSADGGADEDGGTADAGQQDAGPPVRTVRDNVALFGTTPIQNLLVDPLLTGQFISSLSFLALVTDGTDVGQTYGIKQDLPTPTDTPASRGIAFDQGLRVLQAAMFQGGPGPFHVEVWATVRPRDGSETMEANDVAVRVTTGFPDDGSEQTWEIPVVPADTRILGNLTWYHYSADLPDALPMTAAMVLSAKRPDRDLLMTGPQVVPVSLPMESGAFRPSLPRGVLAERVATTAETRSVMRVLSQRAPRLDVPPVRQEQALRRAIRAGQGPLRAPH
jgi:hypothetical protein